MATNRLIALSMAGWAGFAELFAGIPTEEEIFPTRRTFFQFTQRHLAVFERREGRMQGGPFAARRDEHIGKSILFLEELLYRRQIVRRRFSLYQDAVEIETSVDDATIADKLR